MDGIQPDCRTEAGCLVPPLHHRAARAMDIRDKLVRLHRLKIGPKICDLYGVTLDDLELLAIAEDELNHKEEADHGDGSDMDTEGKG